MEGKKLWKNKRRKSLYDLESKDYGLLYRMLDDGKRVTRSSVKKMKLVEAERECLQAVSPQPSGSFEKTLTMNCAEKKIEDNSDHVHCDVDGLSDDSPRVKVVTGELLEEEEGVIVSSHDSHSQELSQDPSTIPHLSKGKEKKIVEKFTRGFIADLKESLLEGANDVRTTEEVDQIICDLEGSLLSSNVFEMALEEPVMLSPHLSEDLDSMRKMQQMNIERVCGQSEDIAAALSKADNESSFSDELDQDNWKSFLTKDQQEMFDSISEGLPKTKAVQEMIENTDKLLNDLREQLSEERKQLNEEIRVMTCVQQPSETPRAVFAQFKSLHQV